jgi:glycosyltransferase involved in cell wall biosynthesis
VTLEYTNGWAHGAHLRTFSIAREWVRRGAAVHFIALESESIDPTVPGPYLERLRSEGVITGFDRLRLRHPRLRGKFARSVVHPLARDVMLGPERRAMIADLDALAQRLSPSAFVFTDRHVLFAVSHLRRYAPVTVDWKDSLRLQHARGVRSAVQRRDWSRAAAGLFETWEAGLEERYYGMRADHHVVVSPVDAATMTRLLGSSAAVYTIPNGIRDRPTPATTPRDPDRLIFTGAMSFPPNYEAAEWFIRRVLPRVVARRPGVRFVVAGANPRPELRALAGRNVEVTGWVDDMHAELARSALYVAPMVSGSGFKNKVVEALAAGTHVVGTEFAFEFLPDGLRALFAPADTPERLADTVVRALDDPAGNAATVARFWQLARDEYDWAHVAEHFARAVAAPRAPLPRVPA